MFKNESRHGSQMVEMNFEPLHQDMRRHVTSGILSSGVAQIVRVLCQFGSVIVLSRLLSPTDFGIIAMVGPVYGFILLFQDLGLGQATVQKKKLSYPEVNAFFWLNVLAGFVLSIVSLSLSPIAAWYYHEPRVQTLTQAMGFLVFVGAIGNQPNAILTRRMEFKAMALINILGSITGFGVSILAAVLLKSYWAVYWGVVAGTVLPVICAWTASGWIPFWPTRTEGIGSMLKFGAGVTSANVSGFLSTNVDNVLIGWRWGELPLGLYDRAYKLLLFPIQRVVGPIMGTLIPVLSRMHDRPTKYRELITLALANTTLALWPGIVWAALMADTLVPTLLGAKWAEAATIFQPLAFAAFIQVINYPAAGLFISQGRTGSLARLSFVSAVVDIGSFCIGLPYGPKGVAIAYAISEYARTPLVWWWVTRSGPVHIRDVVKAVLPPFAGSLASASAIYVLREQIVGDRYVLLACTFFTAYLFAAVIMATSRAGRGSLKHGYSVVQTMFLPKKRQLKS